MSIRCHAARDRAERGGRAIKDSSKAWLRALRKLNRLTKTPTWCGRKEKDDG